MEALAGAIKGLGVSLQELELSSFILDDEGADRMAEAIEALTCLESLSLNSLSSDLGVEGVQSLARALPCLRRLRALTLGLNPTHDVDVSSVIAEALGTLPLLEQLHIEGTPLLGPTGATDMAAAIAGMFCLQSLAVILTDDPDGSGVTALSKALGSLTSLCSLSVGGDAVCDRGAAAIARAAAAHPRLEALRLHCGRLGPERAGPVAAALRRLGSLRTLRLSADGPTGDEGVSRIAEAIGCLTGLEALDVRIPVGPEGATSLATAAQGLTRLRHLDLAGHGGWFGRRRRH